MTPSVALALGGCTVATAWAALLVVAEAAPGTAGTIDQLGVMASIDTPDGVKRRAVRFRLGGQYKSLESALSSRPYVMEAARVALTKWANTERIKWAA